MALYIFNPAEPAVSSDDAVARLEARVEALEDRLARLEARKPGKPGRPASGARLSNAEKQRRYRERLRDRAAAS